jgi:hypothetical protein
MMENLLKGADYTMKKAILGAATVAFMLTTTAIASACSSSIVQPGMSTVEPMIIVASGKTCGIRLNLEGWEVHRIALVERPTKGSVSIEGVRRYAYTAGKSPGQDRFVLEIETTAYDWQSGAKLQRTTWRVTRPVEIR